MKLQYQLSNGMWMDCGDRTEEFLTRCTAPGKDRADTIAALAACRQVGCGAGEMYTACRDEEAVNARYAARRAAAEAAAGPKRERLTCKICGQTGFAGDYPFSTLPGSGRCDDCL